MIRDSGAVLLDTVGDPKLPQSIRSALEVDGDQVSDLHVWRVGPGHMAAVLSVVTHNPMSPSTYKQRLGHLEELCHVTVEVQRCG